jgi:hypothetical protein
MPDADYAQVRSGDLDAVEAFLGRVRP